MTGDFLFGFALGAAFMVVLIALWDAFSNRTRPDGRDPYDDERGWH